MIEEQRISAVYDYRDESGTTLFQVVRFEPKGFAQRRPDRSGGFVWGLDGTRRVLYRLPELLASRERVYLTEGEKDADRLEQLGLVATCNSGGAGKWCADFNQFFSGRDVVILPDNDGAGLDHAQKVASALYGIAENVRVVWLSGLPKKGDVTDWLDAGHTRRQLEEVVELTPIYEPSIETTVQLEAQFADEKEKYTDVGNARRLVARHGKDLRYCHVTDSWFFWTGRQWTLDETGEVVRRAKETIQNIYAEAAAVSNEEGRRALASWAQRSESEARIRSMIALAQSEAGIPVTLAQLDADPWLLNCMNGVINLRSGQLWPHSRQDLCSRIVPVPYDPGAKCERFCNYLAEIMNGNNQLIRYLQLSVGYALTGKTNEQVLHVLYGTGSNGKSTFFEVIRTILGGYAAQASFETFLAKKNDQVRNDIARLAGVRFVSAVEVDSGRRLSETLIKAVTGEDTIAARHLYSEFFEYRPQFKIFLAVNHKPLIRGTEHAIWRRIRLIPFTVKFEDNQQDKDLRDKLLAELPGILAFFVRGCLAWHMDGLTSPQEVVAATAAYKEEMDILGPFLDECCAKSRGSTVAASSLYDAYKHWCERNGDAPVSQRTFGLRLSEREFERCRPGGVHSWKGISLK